MAKPQPKAPAPAPKPAVARFALPKSGPLARALEALKRGDSPTLANVPEGFDAVVVADLARHSAATSRVRRSSSTWRAIPGARPPSSTP